jgi:hypothetical protein
MRCVRPRHDRDGCLPAIIRRGHDLGGTPPEGADDEMELGSTEMLKVDAERLIIAEPRLITAVAPASPLRRGYDPRVDAPSEVSGEEPPLDSSDFAGRVSGVLP